MQVFQAVLILGLVCAHLGSRRLAPGVQVGLHVVLLLLAKVFLPLAVLQDWSYDTTRPVVTQMLWLHALGVGLPFVLPLARAARELGLVARYRVRSVSDLTDAPYDKPSVVMILSRTPDDLGPFATDPDWTVPSEADFPLWTDDHANLLSALR